MKKILALLALIQLFALPAAAHAQTYAGARTVTTTSWVEEWDPVSKSWFAVPDTEQVRHQRKPVTTITTHIVNGKVVSETRETSGQTTVSHRAARYARPFPQGPLGQAIATYGPFRVIDGERAAIHGSTDSNSPADFEAMMRDFPGLKVLEMVDAAGTKHDIANLAVARSIRAAGLTTHVPNGGSARSGGVELFLAGTERTMEPGAQFAVHSWLDNYGREADDFAPDAPEHRLYLDFYKEMGMSEERARNFYAMTNSVPHAGALWLRADDMALWIAPEHDKPRLAAREIQLARITLLDAPTAPLSLPYMAVNAEPVELAAIDTGLAPMIDYSDLSKLSLANLALFEGGAT